MKKVFKDDCYYFKDEEPDFCSILMTSYNADLAYAKDCFDCPFYTTHKEHKYKLAKYKFKLDYKPTPDNRLYKQLKLRYPLNQFNEDE